MGRLVVSVEIRRLADELRQHLRELEQLHARMDVSQQEVDEKQKIVVALVREMDAFFTKD